MLNPEAEPIIVIINKEQKEYLANLGDRFKSLKNLQNNLHIRPNVLFEEEPHGWFRYVVRAVIDKNRLNLQRAMP